MTNPYGSFEDRPVRVSVRFPLHMAVVLSTDEREYTGMTEDVSANGLLFSGEDLPDIGSAVDFKMTMPAEVMGGSDDVLLHCTGRIVRHQQTAGRTMAAAVIDEYSLKVE